jgi:Sec-independent protein translocase protein TatA
MAGKVIDGFLSEDGQTFTSLVESNDENREEHDENLDDLPGDDIDQLVGKIKVDAFPEEQREVVSKLVETIKGMKSELSSVKKDSDTTTVLQKLIDRLNQPNIQQQQHNDEHPKREKLVDQLKFDDPEKDYYAPHLKMLAEAIDKVLDNVDGIGKRFDDNTKNTFVERVQTFIKSNKLPEQVIKRMDEIAKSFGPGAYNDLGRLCKYAKAELGIKDTPTNQRQTESNGRKNIFEFSGKRRSEQNIDVKPAKTMQEAWNQAENALAESD